MKNKKLVLALALVLSVPLLSAVCYAYYRIAKDVMSRTRTANAPVQTIEEPKPFEPSPIRVPGYKIPAQAVSRMTSSQLDESPKTELDELPLPAQETDGTDLEIPAAETRPPKFELLMNLVGKERHIPPDLIEAVLDKPDLDEYLELWTRATKTFEKRNTPNDIADGIERVYQAKAYFTDLTVKQSLKYLLDKVPNVNITHAEYGRGTGIAIVDGTTGSGVIAAHGEHLGVTNIEIPDPNVRILAEETYQWLEDEYYRPFEEAEAARIAEEEARAEALEANRQAAQDRGRARNSTRVQRGQQRTLDIENRLAPQIQRDEAARLEAQRRLLGR